MSSWNHADIYKEPEFAGLYHKFRPRYPVSLFKYLASLVSSHDVAWDCATGNGQAALGLTGHFRIVFATDASPQQVAGALHHEKIAYIIAPAEQSPLPDASVDLVTVALALHWFHHDQFYAEVHRVIRPGGVVACWTYHLQTVSPEVDAIVQRLYADILGPYWLPENKHVENGYEDLMFPFERIETPVFELERQWDLNHVLGYLRTWSASQCFYTETGRDPLEMIREDLAEAWGKPGMKRKVVWRLRTLVGRASK